MVRQWVLNGWVELDYRSKLGLNTKEDSLVVHLYLSFWVSQAGKLPHLILCVRV